MTDRNSRVIGFIAQKPGTANLLCDGDSAVVAGSEGKMHDYINSLGGEPAKPVYTMKKARFGHILECLKLGAAYSFDEESYGRFYSLAKDDNGKLTKFGEDSNRATLGAGTQMMRVQWL